MNCSKCGLKKNLVKSYSVGDKSTGHFHKFEFEKSVCERCAQDIALNKLLSLNEHNQNNVLIDHLYRSINSTK